MTQVIFNLLPGKLRLSAYEYCVMWLWSSLQKLFSIESTRGWGQKNALLSSIHCPSKKHSTCTQVYQIAKTFEDCNYCTTVFWYGWYCYLSSHYRVWHMAAHYKNKTILPPMFFSLLKSYLSNCWFPNNSARWYF